MNKQLVEIRERLERRAVDALHPRMISAEWEDLKYLFDHIAELEALLPDLCDGCGNQGSSGYVDWEHNLCERACDIGIACSGGTG